MIINSGNLSVLYTAFNAAFRSGFGQAPEDHKVFTMDVPSSTRVEEHGWLGQFPSLREWVGERVIRGIEEHGYRVANKKFESTIEVARDDIEDDQYGVYNPMFEELGRSAAAHPCELIYGGLKAGFATECFDGQYFFDTDHPVADGTQSNLDVAGADTANFWYLLDASRAIKPMMFQRRRPYDLKRIDDPQNPDVFKRDVFFYGVDARCAPAYGLWQLAYGSKKALDADAYELARETMMAFKGDEGRPLGIKPTHLVVPPALESEGLKLLNAMLQNGGDSNIYYKTAELIVSPWLA